VPQEAGAGGQDTSRLVPSGRCRREDAVGGILPISVTTVTQGAYYNMVSCQTPGTCQGYNKVLTRYNKFPTERAQSLFHLTSIPLNGRAHLSAGNQLIKTSRRLHRSKHSCLFKVLDIAFAGTSSLPSPPDCLLSLSKHLPNNVHQCSSHIAAVNHATEY